MTKRRLGRAVVMAVLALSLPLNAVAAHDSNGNQQDGNGNHRDHHGKVAVCHKPQGAHPVTIVVSSWALKAHLRHGDAQGPCPTPPKPPKPVQGTCTFDAATSAYNSGPLSTSPLYATGPIRFSWTVATSQVTVPGGYWNELYLASTPPTTYPYAITAGTVSSTNAVNLSLVWPPASPPLSFIGMLTGSTLTGLMTGNFYFSATGTVSCTAPNHEHDDD